MTDRSEQQEELPLSKAAQYLLEECRMVLPGIQTLFGFQLIVVFSPGFRERLGRPEQFLHLLAITLVVVAVAIIMTPAALHRQKGSRKVTELFIRVSTRLLLWSMIPLALGICLDFYLVARVIVGGRWVALLATALTAFFVMMWFVLPRANVLQRAIGGSGGGDA
jgi:hypothetical protein